MGPVLVTGGTGSFGREFVKTLLHTTATVRVFSRDEQKQHQMKLDLGFDVVSGPSSDRVRFLLGDIRDRERLERAMQGCDLVVHAAALKIIPAGEYNPDEVIKTNIFGSHNVIEAAVSAGVRQVVCLSSDKAVAPVNLYGNTKACMEKLAVLANGYSGQTRISVVRYGNVIGSRGSILTLLKKQAERGYIEITHPDASRFWITLPQAVGFVRAALDQQVGGEIFIPKMRSCSVVDLCRTLYPGIMLRYTGMRPGEKVHEALTTEYEQVHDLGWAYQVGNGWSSGHKPILSSGDGLMPASELLALEGFRQEVERAAC